MTTQKTSLHSNANSDLKLLNWIAGGNIYNDTRRRSKRLDELNTQLEKFEKELKAKEESQKSKDGSDEKAKDKTTGEEKKDETKTAEKTNETKKNDSNDDSSWTEKQDADILSMKTENKSWKDITDAVGRSKKDVVLRYKELMNKKQENDKKGDAQDSNNRKDGEKSSDNTNTDASNKGKQAVVEDAPDNEGREKDKNTNQGKDSKPGEEGKSGSAPKVKLPEPDGIWSAVDLALMDELRRRNRSQKWMQLQSDFFNLTGRMIPDHLIKEKFKPTK